MDSFFQGEPVSDKPLWYLGHALQILSEADIVFFGEGWENVRGCKIEHACAEAYGIQAISIWTKYQRLLEKGRG